MNDDHAYELEKLRIQELERIRVIGDEIRASFSMGFSQAMELTRLFTMPQPPSAGVVRTPDDQGTDDEDMMAPGIIDLRTVNEMPPSARAQVLAAYGLQPLGAQPADPDNTEAMMNQAISEGGHEPPKARTYDPSDEGEGEMD